MSEKLTVDQLEKDKKAKVTFIYDGRPIKIKGSNIFQKKKKK